MVINYKKAESTVQPAEIEKSDTIYIRKNIVSESRTGINGNSITFWVYDEAQLTPDEYAEYTATMESPDRRELMKTLNQISLQLDSLGG